MYHIMIYQYIFSDEDLFNVDLGRCPVSDGRRRVLDVGCGTAYWCIDMAKKYDAMDVHGLDLHESVFADLNLYPNLTMHHQIDFTAPLWGDLRESSFDLIRAARLCGSVSDWSQLYHTIYRFVVLRP